MAIFIWIKSKHGSIRLRKTMIVIQLLVKYHWLEMTICLDFGEDVIPGCGPLKICSTSVMQCPAVLSKYVLKAIIKHKVH